MADSGRDQRLRRSWDRQAERYDDQMPRMEQRWFADTRDWLCRQATGDTLEVAVGTGLNLPHYPVGLPLVGVEWSPGMLALARKRAEALGREVDLRQGDARALDLPDAAFDTVVCTFAMCGIDSPRTALAEMRRVLRPGGRLLLADHVSSTIWPLHALQLVVDVVSGPVFGERFARRPARWLPALGFTIERSERLRHGMIERLVATPR